jgi:hypothetical protein
MKLLITISILLLSLSSKSQFIEYDYQSAVSVPQNTTNFKFAYEKWYKEINYINKKKYITYTKMFDDTPIGIKNALKLVRQICQKNNLNFEDPIIDDSYLSSLVNGLDDYEKLDLTISYGYSEISKKWYKMQENNVKSILLLSLLKGGRVVMIINNY